MKTDALFTFRSEEDDRMNEKKEPNHDFYATTVLSGAADRDIEKKLLYSNYHLYFRN